MAKKSHKNPASSAAHSNPTASVACVFDRKLARRDAKQLGLNKGDLPNAIKEVISTLTAAGFEAYIVGGGVRDALLGLQPKDFDAVTNATPNQVKEVFGKRCRIIGRRFLLCHVYSGRDMIEVATFRAPPKDDNHLTEDGMIMRDNVWGDIFQDVVRRDFSINALYYQPFDGFVYDFCGGLADVSTRTIRLLGDTKKRVEEDPVRLLRALRFKAKLGFDFDPALDAQFNADSWRLLAQVSPHRLYDETQKMFTGGYLLPLLPMLFEYGAFDHLLFYPPKRITPLIQQVTVNTDKRIASGKSINPAFFYAALLWENYLYLLEKFKKNVPFVEAQSQAANKVLDKQRAHTAMPKFAEQFIKDIWLMQPRLAEPRKKNLTKLFESPRFRAGFDFLMLREQVEAKNQAMQATLDEPVTLDRETTNGMGHWWAWFQTLNAKQQQQAVDDFDLASVRLRFANVVHDTQADTPTGEPLATPRRERRRHANVATDTHLTEQEQQEKDQLQKLSLASGHQVSQKPAQPLWGTPFNHRAADTQTLSPAPSQGRSTDIVPKTASLADRHAAQDTLPDDNAATGAHFPRQRRKKPVSSDRQLAQVPATRRRRTPSSALSVAEQRQIATNLADTTAGVTKAPVPVLADKHDRATGRKNLAAPSLNTQSTKQATKQATMQPPTQAVPKKRTRKQPSAQPDTAVLNPSEVANTTPAAPVPKKRTRKKPVTTPDAPVTEPTIDMADPVVKPTRRRRAPKIAEDNTHTTLTDTRTTPGIRDGKAVDTVDSSDKSTLIANDSAAPNAKPATKRPRKRAPNAKPTADKTLDTLPTGDQP